jgi:hypothetical protein
MPVLLTSTADATCWMGDKISTRGEPRSPYLSEAASKRADVLRAWPLGALAFVE